MPRPELLLLDVTVNGQRLKEVVRAEQWPGGRLLLPADAWTEARLAVPAQAATLSDGTPGYALDAVAGVTHRIDRQSLALLITAPATAFVGSTFGLRGGLALPPPRPRPGAMLNYDVSASYANGSATSGATLEAIGFSGFGNLVASALVSHRPGNGAGGASVERLDTYWRYDLPHRMETLVVGDTVGVGGGWSRPVRYGGIRWGRDFGMRPGFVTLPQISLAGQAALPSTVEVLVNNARRLSQPVQPGPFDLTNVPITTGAGEIGLVVRDLLGRETLVTPELLRLAATAGAGPFRFLVRIRPAAHRLRARAAATRARSAPATWRQGLTPQPDRRGARSNCSATGAPPASR